MEGVKKKERQVMKARKKDRPENIHSHYSEGRRRSTNKGLLPPRTANKGFNGRSNTGGKGIKVTERINKMKN